MVKDNVIMIAGAKRSGKDTTADLLIKHINKGRRVGLADPMKDILYQTLGLTYEQGETLKNDANYPHRAYLQRFGQLAKQYFGENCWGEHAKHVIANLPKGSTAVISDFRMPVEHIEGSLTIKIINPNVVDTDEHISERALDKFKFDVTIINDGSLDDLEAKVEKLIEDLYASEWLT